MHIVTRVALALVLSGLVSACGGGESDGGGDGADDGDGADGSDGDGSDDGGSDDGGEGGGSTGAGPGATSGGGTEGDCQVQALAAEIGGGCVPRLVTPAACETVDLRDGRTYELAWTTDGTLCETPWTVILAGNPPTEANAVAFQLSRLGDGTISEYGGVATMNAETLAPLTSTDGIYHWVVVGYYGSHPASNAFRVLK